MSLALDKSDQKLFTNAISRIKKSLKTGAVTVSDKTAKQRAKKVRERGVVYLGHIPHGFYEEQMKTYFSQFGKVLRVRLVRSKKTGNSRGHAFIQFLHPEVAQIVAETMNNYLMCNRLLKAEYIPPEKQHPLFIGYNWSKTNYPRLRSRKRTNQLKNEVKTDEKHKEFIDKQFKKVNKIKKLLKSHGIEYDFKFSDIPVDIKLPKEDKQKNEEFNTSNEISVSEKKPLLEVDESDDEIDFPNLNVKRKFKGGVQKKTKTIVNTVKKSLNKPNKKHLLKTLNLDQMSVKLSQNLLKKKKK